MQTCSDPEHTDDENNCPGPTAYGFAPPLRPTEVCYNFSIPPVHYPPPRKSECQKMPQSVDRMSVRLHTAEPLASAFHKIRSVPPSMADERALQNEYQIVKNMMNSLRIGPKQEAVLKKLKKQYRTAHHGDDANLSKLQDLANMSWEDLYDNLNTERKRLHEALIACSADSTAGGGNKGAFGSCIVTITREMKTFKVTESTTLNSIPQCHWRAPNYVKYGDRKSFECNQGQCFRVVSIQKRNSNAPPVLGLHANGMQPGTANIRAIWTRNGGAEVQYYDTSHYTVQDVECAIPNVPDCAYAESTSNNGSNKTLQWLISYSTSKLSDVVMIVSGDEKRKEEAIKIAESMVTISTMQEVVVSHSVFDLKLIVPKGENVTFCVSKFNASDFEALILDDEDQDVKQPIGMKRKLKTAEMEKQIRIRPALFGAFIRNMFPREIKKDPSTARPPRDIHNWPQNFLGPGEAWAFTFERMAKEEAMQNADFDRLPEPLRYYVRDYKMKLQMEEYPRELEGLTQKYNAQLQSVRDAGTKLGCVEEADLKKTSDRIGQLEALIDDGAKGARIRPLGGASKLDRIYAVRQMTNDQIRQALSCHYHLEISRDVGSRETCCLILQAYRRHGMVIQNVNPYDYTGKSIGRGNRTRPLRNEDGAINSVRQGMGKTVNGRGFHSGERGEMAYEPKRETAKVQLPTASIKISPLE